VRPEFAQRVKAGAAIVVAGEGWGSGSSREHAVWALLGAGVKAVVARSFAFIHRRNLVNDALPYLIVTDETFHGLADEGAVVTVDLTAGTVVVAGQRFAARATTPMIRALTAAGGLVPAIQRHGRDVFTTLAGGGA
jgi:aconitate hydratase/homoaconitate hydratase